MSKPYIPKITSFKPQYTRFHFPDRKIDDNLVDKLFLQIEEGNIDNIKKFILNERVTLTIKNNNGETVLHGLLKNDIIPEIKKNELVRFLILNGAPVMSFDKMNVTPLHLASKFQLTTIANILLQNGADPNSKDNQNMTPVHYAVQGVLDNCRFEELRQISKTESNKQEISDITKILITLVRDVLLQDSIKQYLINITNTINRIPDLYYPDDFNAKLLELKQEIEKNIASTFTSPEELKTKIQNKIKSFKTDFDDLAEKIINFKEIQIKDLSTQEIIDKENKRIESMIYFKLFQDMEQKIFIIKNTFTTKFNALKQSLIPLFTDIYTADITDDVINSLPSLPTVPGNEDYIYFIKEDFENEYPYNFTTKHVNKLKFYNKHLRGSSPAYEQNHITLRESQIFNIFYYLYKINKQIKLFEDKYKNIRKEWDNDVFNLYNALDKPDNGIYKSIENMKVALLNILIGICHYNIEIEKIKYILAKYLEILTKDNDKLSTKLNKKKKQISDLINYIIDNLENINFYDDVNFLYKNTNRFLEYINNKANIKLLSDYIQNFNKDTFNIEKTLNTQLITHTLPVTEREFCQIFFDKSIDKTKLRDIIKQKFLTTIKPYGKLQDFHGCCRVIPTYFSTNISENDYDNIEELLQFKGEMKIINPDKSTTEAEVNPRKKNRILFNIIKTNLNLYILILFSAIIEEITKIIKKDKRKEFENYRKKLENKINYSVLEDDVEKIIKNLSETMLRTFIKGKIDSSIFLYLQKNLFAINFDTDDDLLRNILSEEDAFNTYGIDYGFSLEYNEIINDIIYNYDKSYLNTEIIKTKKEIPQEVSKSRELPTFSSLIGLKSREPICNRYNYELVKLLLNNRGRADLKDAIGNTPLVYAIKNHNIDLIELLLVHNGGIGDSSNISGYSPLNYLLKMFNNSISNVIGVTGNIIEYLPNKVFDEVTNDFLENKTYNNKIPVYSDNLFKSALSILNHYFYFEMFRILPNKDRLIKIFSENGYNVDTDIPILKNIDKIPTSTVYQKKRKDIVKQTSDTQEKIKQVDLSIEGLKKELSELIKKERNDTNIERIVTIQEFIKNLEQNKKELEEELYNITQIQKTPDDKFIEIRDTRKKARYVKKITRKIPNLYDNIFNNIINKHDICGSLAYRDRYSEEVNIEINAYLELWKSYLKDETKINNITHIHVGLLSIFRKKEKIEKEILGTSIEFYKIVLHKFVMDYEQLPLYYNENENYALTKILKIIQHIIKHYVVGQLLNSLRKMLAKYFIETNEYQTKIYKNKDNYGRFINEKVEQILKGDVLTHLLCILPEHIVKLTLNIFSSDNDVIKKTNIKEQFKMLNTLIERRGINKGVSLYKNLENYVYNYFIDFSEKATKGLKEMFDGYLHNIHEEYKILQIIDKLTK